MTDLPPSQVTHPSAWLGADLAQHKDLWCYSLNAAEIAELEQAAENFLQQPKPDLARITPADFPLPLLKHRLGGWQHELIGGKGFQVLSGLPVANYSPTEAATIFCGLGCHLGKACSQNAQGHLLGHVKDTSVNAQDANVRIYQTAERQTFHTDSADVVGLLCLQEAKAGGDSMLVSTASIYNRMAQKFPALLPELFKPIATDRRGEVPKGEQPYFTIPLLSWFAGRLTGMYQRQYIESATRHLDVPGLTPAYIAALDAFDQCANDSETHLAMRLQPGDMQFVHNHSLLHDRTAFTDWVEPEKKRHLLRLWLSVPGDRPLPAVFAQRFGTVTIGERGGISTQGTVPHVPLHVH